MGFKLQPVTSIHFSTCIFQAQLLWDLLVGVELKSAIYGAHTCEPFEYSALFLISDFPLC